MARVYLPSEAARRPAGRITIFCALPLCVVRVFVARCTLGRFGPDSVPLYLINRAFTVVCDAVPALESGYLLLRIPPSHPQLASSPFRDNPKPRVVFPSRGRSTSEFSFTMLLAKSQILSRVLPPPLPRPCEKTSEEARLTPSLSCRSLVLTFARRYISMNIIRH